MNNKFIPIMQYAFAQDDISIVQLKATEKIIEGRKFETIQLIIYLKSKEAPVVLEFIKNKSEIEIIKSFLYQIFIDEIYSNKVCIVEKILKSINI